MTKKLSGANVSTSITLNCLANKFITPLTPYVLKVYNVNEIIPNEHFENLGVDNSAILYELEHNYISPNEISATPPFDQGKQVTLSEFQDLVNDTDAPSLTDSAAFTGSFTIIKSYPSSTIIQLSTAPLDLTQEPDGTFISNQIITGYMRYSHPYRLLTSATLSCTPVPSPIVPNFTLDFETLEIPWTPNESYTIELEPGVVIDRIGQQYGNPSFSIPFTTNPPPVVSNVWAGGFNSTIPAVNILEATENGLLPDGDYSDKGNNIVLTWIRPVTHGTTSTLQGNIRLFGKPTGSGSAAQLIKFWNAIYYQGTLNPDWDFNLQQSILSGLRGLLKEDHSYYIVLDAAVVEDKDTFESEAVTDPTQLAFATDTVNFPGLKSNIVSFSAINDQARRIRASGAAYSSIMTLVAQVVKRVRTASQVSSNFVQADLIFNRIRGTALNVNSVSTLQGRGTTAIFGIANLSSQFAMNSNALDLDLAVAVLECNFTLTCAPGELFFGISISNAMTATISIDAKLIKGTPCAIASDFGLVALATKTTDVLIPVAGTAQLAWFDPSYPLRLQLPQNPGGRTVTGAYLPNVQQIRAQWVANNTIAVSVMPTNLPVQQPNFSGVRTGIEVRSIFTNELIYASGTISNESPFVYLELDQQPFRIGSITALNDNFFILGSAGTLFGEQLPTLVFNTSDWSVEYTINNPIGDSRAHVALSENYFAIGYPISNAFGFTNLGRIDVYSLATGNLLHTMYPPVANRANQYRFGINIAMNDEYIVSQGQLYNTVTGDLVQASPPTLTTTIGTERVLADNSILDATDLSVLSSFTTNYINGNPQIVPPIGRSVSKQMPNDIIAIVVPVTQQHQRVALVDTNTGIMIRKWTIANFGQVTQLEVTFNETNLVLYGTVNQTTIIFLINFDQGESAMVSTTALSADLTEL